MHLSVPTNWDYSLLSQISNKSVGEIYGKLPRDFIGGGRSLLTIPEITKKKVAEYIKKVRKSGLEFNYLLNAVCLDNREFTRKGNKQIRKILDWLINIEVDSVTVAIPYLLQVIKKNYPQLKVYVSTMAQVNSVERARLWEDLGADRITLAHQDVNRNFKLLRAIRKNVKCRLQLIVNNGCIYNCPFYIYHTLLLSHASQSNHVLRGFFIDYCSLYCRFKQLSEPVNLIKNDWIRPEDIHYYEDIGYEEFKLVDREMSTEQIIRVVNAYSNRHYEGNLLDILGNFSSLKKDRLSLRRWKNILKYLVHPTQVNIFKLLKLREILGQIYIFIDNQLLEGFLEYFVKNGCDLKSCANCNYCKDWTKRVVRIEDERRLQVLIRKYKLILEDIISGGIFNYHF